MDPLTQYGSGLTRGRREKTLSGLRWTKNKDSKSHIQLGIHLQMNV